MLLSLTKQSELQYNGRCAAVIGMLPGGPFNVTGLAATKAFYLFPNITKQETKVSVYISRMSNTLKPPIYSSTRKTHSCTPKTQRRRRTPGVGVEFFRAGKGPNEAQSTQRMHRMQR